MNARLKTWILTAAALSSGAVLAIYVNAMARIDPFASFRGNSGQAADQLFTELHDVDIQAWRGSKKLVSANVATIEVRQDQAFFNMQGVRNGLYQGDKLRFRFDADTATWDSLRQALQGSQRVHVSNQDFDLISTAFTYTAHTHLLSVPGEATGRIRGGTGGAKEIIYSVDTGEMTTGPASWKGDLGTLMKGQGDPLPNDRKAWDILAASTKHHGKESIYVKAHATDGNIIVKSPKIVRNEETDVIVCSGPVYYYSAKANVQCDKAVIYRKEKRAVLTGHVVMLVKPKDAQALSEKDVIPPFHPLVPEEVAKNRPPAPAVIDPVTKQQNDELRSNDSTRKYPATVLADRIEYWYEKGSRHATVTGMPQAQQELPGGGWRRAWANTAFYDGEADTLKLVSGTNSGDVRMKNSLGDDYTAKMFLFSTADGNDDWSAEQLHATMVSDDPDLTDASKNAGNGVTPPPTTGGPGAGKSKPPLKGPIGKAPR